MSQLPIILLAGNAGSGKDTVGAHLVEHYGAVSVAQADPMKRFAAEIFGFDNLQLWGPSATRNAVDESTVTHKLTIGSNFTRYLLECQTKELFAKVIPVGTDIPAAVRSLDAWFENLYRSMENGLPVSPRLVLQTLGGEWGRGVCVNMWNDYAVDTCLKLLCGGFRYSKDRGLIPDAGILGYRFAVISDGRYRNEILLTRSRGGNAWNVKRLNPDHAAVQAGGIKDHKSERELDTIPPHFYNEALDNSGTLRELYALVNELMSIHYRVTPQ